MEQWVPFGEGEYLAAAAFLVAPDDSAVAVDRAVIEVFTDPQGVRRVRGTGRTRLFLLMMLHEEHDSVDMVIDLGGEFKYRMSAPDIQSGKIFAPDVSAQFQFHPVSPWDSLGREEYEALVGRLKLLGSPLFP